MRDQGFDTASAQALASALRDRGFTPVPAPGGRFRAVRERCEVLFRRECGHIAMEIPVVRLGPDRPLTPPLSDYLTERNEARRGPGAFSVEGDMIWYKASVAGGDPAAAAATALAMQATVEKIGPKILNILR